MERVGLTVSEDNITVAIVSGPVSLYTPVQPRISG